MSNDDDQQEETSPQDPEDLVEDLRRYMAARTPVEVYLLRSDKTPLGFIVHVGDDHAVFARVFQRAWHNGYMALRFSAIEFVARSDDTEFIHRCFTARNEPLPASSPAIAAKFDGLLEVISEQFAMVVLTGHGDGPVDFAGEIVEVSDGLLTARVLSHTGYWESDAKRIPLPELSVLFFGSPYEHTLELVGRLPDAHGQDKPPADRNVESER